MWDLLIHQCDVLQLENNTANILVKQDVAVAGNRIVEVRPAAETPASAHKVIDGRGMLAMPGLVNTHAHVPMVLFRGLAEDVTLDVWFNDYIWPLESNLAEEDVYWGAMLGIAEMIEAGITCVADHYFNMDEVAAAVEQAGIRANLTWAIFGHEGEAKIDATSAFIRRWQGGAGGRITTWLGPHAPYTTGPDYLKLCARRAKELGVGIHTHVSETADQVTLSLREYGITPVRMLLDAGVLEVPTIFGHCLAPTPEDIDIMADHAVGVAQAPKTYMKAGMGTAPVLTYRQRGIPVGLASDGACSSNTLDLLEQMRLLALTQKLRSSDPRELPVGEVLDIAFHGGPRVLGLGEVLGDVKPGMLADLVLLRQDSLATFPRYNPAANLVYSSSAADVDTVICDGKVLMEGRKLLTLDKARIKQEVSTRLERLSQRVPGRRIATYPV